MKENKRNLKLQLAEKIFQLKIESALEKVSSVAMQMNEPADMLIICKRISFELKKLGVKDIRNVQTAIFYESKGTYMNYEYYAKHDKTFITETAYTHHRITKTFAKKMIEGKGKFYRTHINGKKISDWIAYQKTTNVFIDPYLNKASSLDYYWFSLGPVALGISTYSPLIKSNQQLFKRFLKVFELAYRRYLDIEKAEAQVRESKIQLALERVRARTMAMQKSEELSETSQVLYEQFKQLEEIPKIITIGIMNEEERVIEFWVTDGSSRNSKFRSKFNASIDEPILLKKVFTAWKEKRKSFAIELTGKKLQEWINYRVSLSGVGDKNDYRNRQAFFYVAFFSKGMLSISTSDPRAKETTLLLERFAAVFEQTYTRFLDLQKAEAQAREAEIQLALERVRARTMAMQKQNDLLGVLDLLVEQLIKLGVRLDIANFSNGIPGADWDLWIDVVTANGEVYSNYVHFPGIDHPYFHRVRKNIEVFRNGGGDLFKDVFSKEEKDSWQHYICTQTIYKDIVSQEDKEYIFGKPGYTWSMILLKDTWVSICRFDDIPFSDEEDALFRRFANAFGQAYTRFLDLQKAEAQAREAQIEAGLERVRSRAMAMQTSEELNALIGTVFTELTKLDLILTRCIIQIYEGNEKGCRWWMANSETPDTPMNFFVKYANMPFFNEYLKGWYNGSLKWQYILEGDNKIKTDDFLFNETELSRLPGFVIEGMRAPDRVYLNASFNNFGNLTLASLEPLSDEHFDIMLRFAKVFDLTYTRFNDLKQAEAQAREAQIEAGLERVRGKAMAMHTSRDLAETIKVFYHEMELLSVTPRRCGVGLLDRKTRVVEISTMNTTEEGNSIEVIGRINMVGHPVLEGIYDNWLKQKEFQPVLRGNEIKEYYKLLRPQISYPDYPNDAVQFGYFFYFPEGGVYAWTNKELGEDELKIYRRFTSVLSLTYKRYKDLSDAEARALVAVREASLDRVRGEIASMRTADDLQRITPLVWRELTALGVPFFRCGVYIVNEEKEKIIFYVSTPEGKPLAALDLEFDTSDTTRNGIIHWRRQKVFIEHWTKDQFTDFTNLLMNQGQIQTAITYQGGEEPPETLTLQFVPFKQGMMYVGSAEPLDASQIELVQALADAFSVAYARYEDFTKLEHAKQSIENTLSELKATQKQLIQSEKMASLGELTAGIAHEIQNPLNFVNNFSEVNKEMLEELKAERLKPKAERDESLENELINDVIDNEEKINHHGKRADAIVKGMLQHSRSSTGVKQPTDINALADEYLRLSYHGLRAKDKNFNAEIKTDFDETIEKINIIPQDIGRVLLNLFNNAFYAASQEKSKNFISYKPAVSVSTKKEGNSVIITVSDNGNGIAENIKEKIFQPFFTTKPTGSGTGLGLSLSYDIVKAHGGEIRVESKEGEGTEFTVHLNVNTTT